MSEEKCPKCGGEAAYYQAMEFGYVGCKANEGACLLAKKSWTLSQWEELKSIFASADEGYPGAAHDRLTVNNRLRDLVNKWHGNAGILAEMGDHAASKAFLRCRKDLCEATGESGL